MHHAFEQLAPHWYAGPVDDDSPCSTPIAPPVDYVGTEPGTLRARWARSEWCVEAYPAPAPVSVPAVVTMRQARLALRAAGLLASVAAAIELLPDDGTREDARITWEFSAEVQRRNGLVAALAPALGLDDAQIDQLFITAAAL